MHEPIDSLRLPEAARPADRDLERELRRLEWAAIQTGKEADVRNFLLMKAHVARTRGV